MKLDRAFLDAFAALGNGEPPSKKLSLLTRPAFVAPRGRTLVWGDWSNIEARVLPWLADSKGAEEKLDIFRAVDKDPKLPDVYMRTAVRLVRDGPFVGAAAEDAWAAYKSGNKDAHDLRQSRGKVPELSLGFGGGKGALMAMATNYGVYLDEKTAQEVVLLWREENRWAPAFWGYHGRDGSSGLWGAVNRAVENPDAIQTAGRVAYVFDKAYLGGTLFCALPCGRLLTYPGIKWEWREVEDKKTGKLVDRYQLTCIKGYARVALWHGKFAENITQATAASILRRTLKRLDREWHRNLDGSFSRYEEFMPVVMHTHDEVLSETAERDEARARAAMQNVMELQETWDQGLPIKAEIQSSWYYTKAGD